MYSEQLLVDYLATALPTFVVELGQTKSTDQTDQFDNTTRVYVSHVSQKPNVVDPYHAFYDSIEESSLLVTQVQLWTQRSSLADNWNSLQSALVGWTPFIGDSNYSSIGLLEANLEVFIADKVCWIAYYGLIIPRIS